MLKHKPSIPNGNALLSVNSAAGADPASETNLFTGSPTFSFSLRHVKVARATFTQLNPELPPKKPQSPCTTCTRWFLRNKSTRGKIKYYCGGRLWWSLLPLVPWSRNRGASGKFSNFVTTPSQFAGGCSKFFLKKLRRPTNLERSMRICPMVRLRIKTI